MRKLLFVLSVSFMTSFPAIAIDLNNNDRSEELNRRGRRVRFCPNTYGGHDSVQEEARELIPELREFRRSLYARRRTPLVRKTRDVIRHARKIANLPHRGVRCKRVFRMFRKLNKDWRQLQRIYYSRNRNNSARDSFHDAREEFRELEDVIFSNRYDDDFDFDDLGNIIRDIFD